MNEKGVRKMCFTLLSFEIEKDLQMIAKALSYKRGIHWISLTQYQTTAVIRTLSTVHFVYLTEYISKVSFANADSKEISSSQN